MYRGYSGTKIGLRIASRKNSVVCENDLKLSSSNNLKGISSDTLNNQSEKPQDVVTVDEPTINISSPIVGITNWNLITDDAYGIADSLYEKNLISNEQTGNPVADCYGVVARSNCAVLALADGVNWGKGIVTHLKYLDKQPSKWAYFTGASELFLSNTFLWISGAQLAARAAVFGWYVFLNIRESFVLKYLLN